MIDQGALQENAREAIKARKLPNRAPSRIWSGNGFWMNCVICGTLVNADELGYELQFAEDGGLAGSAEYHAHVRCFMAWDKERRHHLPDSKPEGVPLPAAQGQSTIHHLERRPYKRDSK